MPPEIVPPTTKSCPRTRNPDPGHEIVPPDHQILSPGTKPCPPGTKSCPPGTTSWLPTTKSCPRVRNRAPRTRNRVQAPRFPIPPKLVKDPKKPPCLLKRVPAHHAPITGHEIITPDTKTFRPDTKSCRIPPKLVTAPKKSRCLLKTAPAHHTPTTTHEIVSPGTKPCLPGTKSCPDGTISDPTEIAEAFRKVALFIEDNPREPHSHHRARNPVPGHETVPPGHQIVPPDHEIVPPDTNPCLPDTKSCPGGTFSDPAEIGERSKKVALFIEEGTRAPRAHHRPRNRNPGHEHADTKTCRPVTKTCRILPKLMTAPKKSPCLLKRTRAHHTTTTGHEVVSPDTKSCPDGTNPGSHRNC